MTASRLLATALASSVAAAAVFAFGLPSAHGADDPAAKPVAEIEDVMLTVNDDGDETAVLQTLRASFNKPTLTEDEWKAAKAKATMVVEAGNLLLTKKPPKGADTPEGLAGWKTKVVAYRDGAEAIRAAATKKDAAAGKAAVQAITKQCNDCHKAHQPEE